ncbi:CsbD family protein [Microvirga sp. 2MCAF38]|uniref:CsbD family protein n=1 Tax=Microvirga sp. 2MCAF38 TaxID=3232989 RepID=UPI003F9B7473
MNKDRIEGGLKNVKGSVKEGLGKLVGDTKLEAEGKVEKTEGRIQNTVGGIKDSIRGNRD